MQLSAAAAAGITAACPRVAGSISRDGGRAQLGDQVVVLRGLRGLQAQLLICAFQIAHLALRQEVQDRAAVLVLVVNDVTRSGVDRVAGVAGLRRHVVPHLGDSRPVFAAIMLSQRLFIPCFSRFPREFRLYLHPPLKVGVGHSCQDYWFPSSPVSR